jgi:riboflavin biosynthesis pyrimidine reductase
VPNPGTIVDTLVQVRSGWHGVSALLTADASSSAVVEQLNPFNALESAFTHVVTSPTVAVQPAKAVEAMEQSALLVEGGAFAHVCWAIAQF